MSLVTEKKRFLVYYTSAGTCAESNLRTAIAPASERASPASELQKLPNGRRPITPIAAVTGNDADLSNQTFRILDKGY
jgi:hypothetical protein